MTLHLHPDSFILVNYVFDVVHKIRFYRGYISVTRLDQCKTLYSLQELTRNPRFLFTSNIRKKQFLVHSLIKCLFINGIVFFTSSMSICIPHHLQTSSKRCTIQTVNTEFGEKTTSRFSKLVRNACFHHVYINTSRPTWKHCHVYRVNRGCPCARTHARYSLVEKRPVALPYVVSRNVPTGRHTRAYARTHARTQARMHIEKSVLDGRLPIFGWKITNICCGSQH